MENKVTCPGKTCCNFIHGRAALRGAVWTIPVWAAILESSLAAASPRFDAYLLAWPDLCTAFYILFLFGSSLCALFSFGLTSAPLGFADAAKKGLNSALAVAAAYLVFAFAALFNADPGGPAWGGTFGVLSACGALIAALAGAFAKLGYLHLTKKVLNPYKEPPEQPLQ